MIVRLLGSQVNLRRFFIFEFVLNMLVHWLNNCMLGARMLWDVDGGVGAAFIATRNLIELGPAILDGFHAVDGAHENLRRLLWRCARNIRGLHHLYGGDRWVLLRLCLIMVVSSLGWIHDVVRMGRHLNIVGWRHGHGVLIQIEVAWVGDQLAQRAWMGRAATQLGCLPLNEVLGGVIVEFEVLGYVAIG